MSATINLPDECISYDSAGGDPFLVHFHILADTVDAWCRANCSSDYEIENRVSILTNHKIWFRDSADAYAFMLRWYDEEDYSGLDLLPEELGDLAGPIERSWGCLVSEKGYMTMSWGSCYGFPHHVT